MRPTTRTLIVLGCLGALGFWVFLGVAEHTAPPATPIAIVVLAAVVAFAVGPWSLLVYRKIAGEPGGVRTFRRVIAFALVLAAAGIMAGALIGWSGQAKPVGDDTSVVIALFSIFAAGVLVLIGAVLLPWMLILTRAVTRERTGRVRAEQRAEVAAHLHDSVLQALTLIHKQAEDPRAVRGLARRTDRELRAWLYGTSSGGEEDFADAIKAVAETVEDTYDITVEVATVGTCRLSPPTRAVVGGVQEALTNAAKHAQVGRISVFAEVSGDAVYALVRDRGCGFDLPAATAGSGRGITDSIQGRMHQHGGTASLRSSPGSGTEVELRMPVVARHG